MRTKIGVLSVFLVFLSLSCQKDSGVESAGNTPQKVNSIQKGNTTQTDNVPKKYTIYMKITQHIPGEEDYVCLIESRVSDIEPSNAFEWGNFHTRPSESVCTFDIECNFSWEGCPEFNPGYPKICLFSVIKVDNFNNYHEIWRTWRDKPWGSIHGNDGINFYSINLAEPFENDALYYFDMSYGVD